MSREKMFRERQVCAGRSCAIATAEDDGVLLSVGFDADADQSFLVVINATDMAEIARVNMVGHLAANFHGKWCPEGADHCIGL